MTPEDVRRAVAHSEERLCAAVCTKVTVGADLATLYCLPSLPRVYDVNVIRRPRLTVEGIDRELAVLWEAVRAKGLAHLFFAGDDLATQNGIGDALRTRGFLNETLLCMTLVQAPAPWRTHLRFAPTVEEDAMRQLYDRVHREEAWYTPVVARDVTTALWRRAQAGAVTLYGAYERDTLVGALGLSYDGVADGGGGVASLVAVATDPNHRNRGVCKALLAHAIAAVQTRAPSLVYLLTRQVDWPHRLYRKLGFVDAFRFDSYSAER